MTQKRKSRFPLPGIIFFSTVALIIALIRHLPEDEQKTTKYSVPIDEKSSLSFQYETDDNRRFSALQKLSDNKSVWRIVFEDAVYPDDIDKKFYSQSVDSQILLKDKFIFPLTTVAEDERIVQSITAVDVEKGTVLWRTPVKTSVSQRWFYSRVIEDMLAVNATPVFGEPVLYCIDLKNGKIRWQQPGTDAPAGVLREKDYLLVHDMAESSVRIYNLKDGQYQDHSTLSVGVIKQGAYYYVAPRRNENEPYRLAALNLSTQKQKVLFALPDLVLPQQNSKIARFAVFEDKVIFPYGKNDETGLTAVDSTTGKMLWKTPFKKGTRMGALSWNDAVNRFWMKPRGITFGECHDLLFYRPQNDVFYRAETPWMPIFTVAFNHSFDEEAEIKALNLKTGETMPLMTAKLSSCSAARFGDKYVIARTLDDLGETYRFFEFNGATGSLEREFSTSSPFKTLGTPNDIFYRFLHSHKNIFERRDWTVYRRDSAEGARKD